MAWLLLTLGCGQARPEPAETQPPSPVTLPSLFDAASTGAIHGTVVWSGVLPEVPPFEIRSFVTASNPPRPRLIRENPHAPRIDAESKGVAGAVVFLRKVDPRQARPWDHPPVTIEHRDRQLFVVQGGVQSRVGFVRQGGSVTMVSRESDFNTLQAGGAAFFSLPFPDPNQPLTRVFHDQGLVELTSGAGHYWMRAYLFVSEHPYFTRTNTQGNFELRQVPPGRYQIVCWMPNWHKKSQDRDPESGLVTRLFFHPPVELQREVVVEAATQRRIDFTVASGQFTH